jgi:hypothetical protein
VGIASAAGRTPSAVGRRISETLSGIGRAAHLRAALPSLFAFAGYIKNLVEPGYFESLVYASVHIAKRQAPLAMAHPLVHFNQESEESRRHIFHIAEVQHQVRTSAFFSERHNRIFNLLNMVLPEDLSIVKCHDSHVVVLPDRYTGFEWAHANFP